MMVGLPLEVDSEGGHAHQPLLRRHQHAESFGGIERDGGRGRLPLVRTAQLKRPWLVGRWQGHL